ncbi:MAG: hypothetical protein AB1716_16860 [Planctomycetota bacterium]
MLPEALNQELMREPYVPLRLHLSDGTHVDVDNPALTLIAHGALYVARTDRPHSRISDDFRLISLRHIIRIELLEAAAS